MRALISVFDKSGVVEVATKLAEAGVELISSGGTASVLKDAGVSVTDVTDVTGFPPMLGHRVVTLHPKIHGGILADRRDSAHLRDMEDHSIDLIDLVIVNLYPFSSEPSIELIDIGGPTLLRAAAKNHEYVTVVVDPSDYEEVLSEIAESQNTTSELRKRLAAKAFSHTAAYDAAISGWMNESVLTNNFGEPKSEVQLPDQMVIALDKVQDLRYGENPHQVGARYKMNSVDTWWDSVEQLSGKEMSYLNVFDADAAWRLANNLGDGPACAIIKHANPCGVSRGDTIAQAYERAFSCDERSAFGGIVACNHPVDTECVALIEDAAQADMIIAPGFEEGVLERLVNKRKNTIILKAEPPKDAQLLLRQLGDHILVQQSHHFSTGVDDWTIVTDRQPTAAEMSDARMAWRVCSYVSSNAIVLTKDGAAWGIGAGQQNRVDAGRLANEKANGRAKGGACASDAFFPFPDGLEVAADAGVSCVIQPGGSVNDDAVIAAANELGLAMIFTGERQFRH